MNNNAPAVNQNNNESVLTLRPRVHDRITRFLNEKDRIFELVDAFGSPLNLIFPQMIEENLTAFRKAYTDHNLSGRIYMSTKPNKAYSPIRQAALQPDAGIDVSSEEGLKIVLGCGFHPDRIECTGPKNLNYLALALQQNIIINVDNFEELEQILSLRKTLNITRATKIFVRLTGFYSPRLKFTSHDTTFGIPVSEKQRIFEFLNAHKNELSFQGFSFHFNSKVIEQKIVALENMVQATLDAFNYGLEPKGMNIGGGFDISYAADKEEWQNYVSTLKDSLRRNDESLTWNNGGLGFRNEGGLIKGAPAFLDHGPDISGVEDFYEILSLRLPSQNNATLANILNDCLLELYIEPGRSVFDQVGITVGRVNHVKKSEWGETLVNLDMNRSNLNSAQQKLLTDPVVLSQDDKDRSPCPEGVYYTGNLCLTYDMITYNKTWPSFRPEAGDLVIFMNTAAYIMDFVESATLHQKIAEKITVTEQGDCFRWFQDENYNPARHACIGE